MVKKDAVKEFVDVVGKSAKIYSVGSLTNRIMKQVDLSDKIEFISKNSATVYCKKDIAKCFKLMQKLLPTIYKRKEFGFILGHCYPNEKVMLTVRNRNMELMYEVVIPELEMVGDILAIKKQ